MSTFDRSDIGLGVSTHLLIGVTGHRDVRADDEHLLAERLRTIFCELQTRFSSTPILLLSSLAEGADRLAARVAYDVGVDVCVVLPMPLEYFRLDFADAASTEEFELLYNRATGHILLPLSDGEQIESLADTMAREQQYIKASLYLARYSHILIAFWDGFENPAPGGTYYAVRARLIGSDEFRSSASDPLDDAEVGMLYHILTPRRCSPSPNGIAGTLAVKYPPTHTAHHYDEILVMLDEYNRDVQQWYAEHWQPNRCAIHELYPHANTESPALERFCRQLFAADSVAVLYQHRTRRAFIGLFTLVFAAATVFDIYAHLHHWTGKYGLIGYLLFFVIALFWYWTAQRRRYQSKYLDYRAVTEGMRVQLHWHIAGVERMVGEHYLRKQKSELDWIRYALNAATIELNSRGSEHIGGSMMHRLELSYRQWVESQKNYFARTHISELLRLERLDRWIERSFGAAFVLAIIQLFVPDTYAIIIPMGLLPVVAGLLVGYIEKLGLHGHVKSSEYMASLFHRAERRIAAVLARGDHHTAKNLLFELGKEALGENGDWLLYHRERQLEVPKG
ncbi:MAG: hypothetical protein N2663_07945 [Chlorobi bacterium]|nr:hypothetical protein [Chlorobiota bacterium]